MLIKDEVLANKEPLVSVVCMCYNHENFVEEALASVFNQTYNNVEVIIVDDKSTDQSTQLIRNFLSSRSEVSKYEVKTLFLPANEGNCKAFNRGLALAKGKYIIDFATDDVMLTDRIEQQVTYFEQLSPEYGVVFTEAAYINTTGELLYYHYRDRMKHLQPVPTGNIYAQALARYFISSPTMMVKRQVLEELGGYDEQLAYEDFDFWVRSSRLYLYAYLSICTTKVRKFKGSMSTKIYKRGDKQLHSTYLVCRKAAKLVRTPEEQLALIKRIKFELRQAIFYDNRMEAKLFFSLLGEQINIRGWYLLLYFIYKLRIKLAWARRLHHRFRSYIVNILYK